MSDTTEIRSNTKIPALTVILAEIGALRGERDAELAKLPRGQRSAAWHRLRRRGVQSGGTGASESVVTATTVRRHLEQLDDALEGLAMLSAVAEYVELLALVNAWPARAAELEQQITAAKARSETAHRPAAMPALDRSLSDAPGRMVDDAEERWRSGAETAWDQYQTLMRTRDRECDRVLEADRRCAVLLRTHREALIDEGALPTSQAEDDSPEGTIA
jgi:hypothetical protein